MPTQAESIGMEAIPIITLVLYLYSRFAVVWIVGVIALLRRKGAPGERTVPAKLDNSV
jgi:hypothetical protein